MRRLSNAKLRCEAVKKAKRRYWLWWGVIPVLAAVIAATSSLWVPVLSHHFGLDREPAATSPTAGPSGRPALATSAMGLAFEPLSGPLEFEVWNSGSGTLEYQLSSDASWLSLTPATGSSAGEHRVVRADVKWDSIGYGGHSARIAVIPSTGATGYMAVTVAAIAEPCLIPASLRFDVQTGAQVLEVRNCGSGSLDISVSSSANCLTVRPSSVSISDERVPLVVAVDTTGLAAGQRTETITVKPRVGPAKTVLVTINVPADPNAPKEPVVLFQDRFTNARSSAWAITSANWSFADGYCSFSSAAMSGTAGTALLPMGIEWENYRVEADVYMPPADVSQACVGLIVRAQGDLDSWVAAVGTSGILKLVVRTAGENVRKQELSSGFFVGWQHVIVEARGSTFTLYVNSIKRCELVDATYLKGMPGLCAWDAWQMIDFDRLAEPRTLLVDNFVVTSL